MKLPHALILQQNEEMRKEIAETVESTKLTVRERKKLENVVAEMTVEASKTRTRRRKAVKE